MPPALKTYSFCARGNGGQCRGGRGRMPAVRGLASRPWPDQAPRLAGVQTTPLKRSMGAQLRPGSPLMIAITIDHPYRPIGIT
jgi:hypothetical protein